MSENKEYSVNWEAHMSYFKNVLHNLWLTNELSDVTLICEGKKIPAHKMILSACSSYFHDSFIDMSYNCPVVIVVGVEYEILKSIIKFIYYGEVSIDTNKLDLFIKTAKWLKISGLSDATYDSNVINDGTNTTAVQEKPDYRMREHGNQDDKDFKSVNEEPPTKKSKAKDTPKDPILQVRNEEENVSLTDIKCEPTDIVIFNEPLLDPLQPDPSSGYSQNLGDEEMKRSSKWLDNSQYTNDNSTITSKDPPGRLSGQIKEHILEPIPQTGIKRNPTRQCRICKTKGKRSETRYICNNCCVALHKGSCYTEYHTLQTF